jgi:serine phosphatase RsbU (regulator of sigma subunit)/anti-sigma regulatory factor (Ser/Thr protein kinase)
VRSYLAVPVRSARGEVLGGLLFGHPQPARFTDVDERLAEGIAAHAAVAIDNARLYEAEHQSREVAERAQRRLAVLADASRVLALSLDVDEILGELAQIVVPGLADACVVYLAGADATLHPMAAAPTDSPTAGGGSGWPGRDPVAVSDTVHPVARTFGSGESVLSTELGGGVTSAMVVALVGREGPLGALALSTTASSGRLLSDDDVSLAEELGRRAAVAVEHARLYASQRSAAETLQHSLLPEVLPELPGVAIASRYQAGGPGVEVGGDWYDVLTLPDGRLALAMGDVVGRGVSAASLMGQLRNGLRAYVVEGRSPGQVLGLLDRLLREVGATHQMATLVVMVLDPETGELRYANAGHPPPLVATDDGVSQYLEGAVSVPLGAIGHAEYPEATFALTAGSTLILYTDGLVEDRTMSLDVGLALLQASLLTAPDDLDAMCEHVTAHVRAAECAQDDMAILAVRWLELGATLELQLPSQARVLRPLRAALRRWLAAAGVSDHEAYEILVATTEACSNAIRHGAPQATHFDLRAELNGDLAIVVRSAGRWRERRPSAPGGRGLDIMRQFMDETQVDGGDESTEIRMRRRLMTDQPVAGAGVDAP